MLPPMSSLLVPLDGSRLAEATIPIALDLREHLGVRVTLLHVLEHDAPESVHGDPHLTNEASAAAYLADVARRFTSDDGSVETHVHPNPEHDVAKSIARAVARMDSGYHNRRRKGAQARGCRYAARMASALPVHRPR